MIRYLVALPAIVLCAVVLPGQASAQYFPQQPYNPQYGGFNPQYQPTLTPYLGMLNTNPAVGYYQGTRGAIPTVRQNFLNTQFGMSLLDLQRQQTLGTLPTEEISLLPGTGHPTAFGYTFPYYGLNTGPRSILPQAAPQTYQGSRRATKQ
jgi:hypothetical protein